MKEKRIYDTRMLRELKEVFTTASLDTEVEIESGVLLLCLSDRISDQEDASHTPLWPDETSNPHTQTRHRLAPQLKPGSVTLQRGHNSQGDGDEDDDVLEVPNFTEGLVLTIPLEEVYNVDIATCGMGMQRVRALICRPDLLGRWCGAAGHLKFYSSEEIIDLVHSKGVRLVVTFQRQFFTSWGIGLPERFDSTVSNNNDHKNDEQVCIAMIEITEAYPLSSPRVSFGKFVLQNDIRWYHNSSNHLLNKPSNTPRPLIKHPLPLVSLDPSTTTRLVIGESWSPSISLMNLVARLSAFVREQVVSHTLLEEILAPQSTDHGVIEALHRSNDEEHETSRTESGLLWLNPLAVFLISSTIRIIMGYQPHSGQFNSPTFGDYEAQRHWKEVTYNLPINEWYNPTPSNKLEYWGLDYPPLTAYHELFLGWISHVISPESVSLTSNSRGHFTPLHKLFMRWTSLITDLLIFHSAAYFFWMKLPNCHVFGPLGNFANRTSRQARLFCLLLFLTCPPFILIDHGHFQYNSIPLGLVLWSINCVAIGRRYTAIICVTCAILYKQTMLYFAPAFACFFLGITTKKVVQIGWLTTRYRSINFLSSLHKVSKLVMVSAGTAIFIFVPIIISGLPLSMPPIIPSSLAEKVLDFLYLTPVIPVVRRIFPFHRGLYEDYVSNVWVSLAPLVKLNRIALSSARGMKFALTISAVTTILAFLPSSLDVMSSPTFPRVSSRCCVLPKRASNWQLIWICSCIPAFIAIEEGLSLQDNRVVVPSFLQIYLRVVVVVAKLLPSISTSP